MIAINLIRARVCSSRNHSSAYDAEPVVMCLACTRLFCTTCEGAADGFSELCDRCWRYVMGRDEERIEIRARKDPHFTTAPETLCGQTIRLTRLMFKHGTLQING